MIFSPQGKKMLYWLTTLISPRKSGGFSFFKKKKKKKVQIISARKYQPIIVDEILQSVSGGIFLQEAQSQFWGQLLLGNPTKSHSTMLQNIQPISCLLLRGWLSQESVLLLTPIPESQLLPLSSQNGFEIFR